MSGTPHRPPHRAARRRTRPGRGAGGLTACSSGGDDGGVEPVGADRARWTSGSPTRWRSAPRSCTPTTNVVVSRISEDRSTRRSARTAHTRAARSRTLEGHKLICHCHGSRFDATNGKVLHDPAVEPLAEAAGQGRGRQDHRGLRPARGSLPVPRDPQDPRPHLRLDQVHRAVAAAQRQVLAAAARRARPSAGRSGGSVPGSAASSNRTCSAYWPPAKVKPRTYSVAAARRCRPRSRSRRDACRPPAAARRRAARRRAPPSPGATARAPCGSSPGRAPAPGPVRSRGRRGGWRDSGPRRPGGRARRAASRGPAARGASPIRTRSWWPTVCSPPSAGRPQLGEQRAAATSDASTSERYERAAGRSPSGRSAGSASSRIRDCRGQLAGSPPGRARRAATRCAAGGARPAASNSGSSRRP